MVEQKHDHIGVVDRCFRHQASMSLYFWDDSYSAMTFTINQLSSVNMSNTIPYEILYQCSQDFSLLRILDMQCFPLVPCVRKNKLHSTTIECCFIGNSLVTLFVAGRSSRRN